VKRKRSFLKLEGPKPEDWPLKRPITYAEWHHVIKATIMRRVPHGHPIETQTLIRFAGEDVQVGVKMIVLDDNNFRYEKTDYGVFVVEREIRSLKRAGLLRVGLMVDHREGVFRTDSSEMFDDFLPESIKAVLNYLPILNLMDMLAHESLGAD